MFYFMVFLSISLCTQELVKNGSFEEIQENQPSYWNLYIEPEEGAYGKVDTTTYHTGKHSVLISHLRRYKKEPLNNWNQRILVPGNLEKVEFHGFIKIKDVFKAYFLIQFWSNEGKIIDSVKSDEVSGTSEWTSISKEFSIPKGTDFIMLRCILEGMGTVWFDDISICPSSNDTIEPHSEELKIIFEKLDSIEKEINDLRGEYIYLRNRVDELEKRIYNIREHFDLEGSDYSQKIKIKDNNKLQSLPSEITVEDIRK